MSERPRRSARQPPRYQQLSPPPAPRTKRKAQDVDPADQLHYLLQNPKSALTTIDISDLINASSWGMLSTESQAALKALLPPTTFHGFQSYLEPSHPSADADSMAVDQPSGTPSSELDTTVFTDPHFLAAARTFQDHIYSDWMSDSHKEKVNKFQAGIRDGTLAAPWKDEVWEKDNRPSPLKSVEKTSIGNVPAYAARAGEAAEVRLFTLAKNDVLRVGDVITYKRNFSVMNMLVEKDVIIQSIHPKTHAITVLMEPGLTKYLPAPLLLPQPLDPSAPTQSMTITSPSMLETGLLDLDGRVDRQKRPNGNAWKCFTVWRWRGDPVNIVVDGERGGRENHGTLFYLRSTYYHER